MESIEQLEHELAKVKQQQTQTAKLMPWSELPEKRTVGAEPETVVGHGEDVLTLEQIS